MTVPKITSLRCLRSFSTTLHTAKPTTQSQVPRYTKGPPPYPYGPALYYKQSDSGLYGGVTIQFDNKVSEKNKHKSRRAWRPNIHNKRLWSDGLGRFVQVKVQARVLRTIDKCGGLDGYLLGEKPGRIKELGVLGWRLRWLVMRTGRVRRRVRGEREALGLVGQETAMSRERVEGRKGRGVADTLEDEVERASGEVVEHIEGARASPEDPNEELRHMKNTIDPPPASPTKLENRINRLTDALEAETARRASQTQTANPSLTATTPPSQPDEPEATPTNTGRRYTEGENRAWRAARKLDLDSTSSSVAGGWEGGRLGKRIGEGEWEEAQLGKRIGEIEEAVQDEIVDVGEEGGERLESAMGRLRRARMELEGLRGEVVEMKGEEGRERGGSEGGVLGRIMGLFRKR